MQRIFSIVIPIYNMEQFLPRCLDSIIAQTYPHLEIILVNDGSQDKSPQICDAYANKDNRIKVIHKTNAGVSEARNTALDNATGDYISFVDPDDWILPTMYEKLAAVLSTSDIDILRFNAFRNKEVFAELPFEGIYEGVRLEQDVLLPLVGSRKYGGMFILGILWIHVIKRNLIEDNHLRFNKHIQRCEDRLFTITSFFHAKRVCFIKDALYNYVVNEGSLSNRHDPRRWEQELIYLAELKKEYNHFSPNFVQEADERIKTDYILRAVTSINNDFFSDNKNSFCYKYKRVSLILNDANVRRSIKKLPKNPLGVKGNLILFLIKIRSPFLLTLLEMTIVNINRLKNKLVRLKNG